MSPEGGQNRLCALYFRFLPPRRIHAARVIEGGSWGDPGWDVRPDIRDVRQVGPDGDHQSEYELGRSNRAFKIH
eukprot:scaffold19643_cov37-Tisochrysis_lutea.AAC.1